mmetsp:Transcript_30177/g.82974  ORF Transcript_30177/g.82974 Transcript_30177/m.82974 type:complete len:262 (-) Transcript_30177:980-1765(-)
MTHTTARWWLERKSFSMARTTGVPTENTLKTMHAMLILVPHSKSRTQCMERMRLTKARPRFVTHLLSPRLPHGFWSCRARNSQKMNAKTICRVIVNMTPLNMSLSSMGRTLCATALLFTPSSNACESNAKSVHTTKAIAKTMRKSMKALESPISPPACPAPTHKPMTMRPPTAQKILTVLPVWSDINIQARKLQNFARPTKTRVRTPGFAQIRKPINSILPQLLRIFTASLSDFPCMSSSFLKDTQVSHEGTPSSLKTPSL